MTIEECESAAYRRLPVVHDGVRYARISKISRVFTAQHLIERGWRKVHYEVELEDKNGRSYTIALPERVHLVETDIEEIS